MNEPISFEIAKLLKESGFDVPVNCGYGKNGKLYHILDMAIDFEEAKIVVIMFDMS